MAQQSTRPGTTDRWGGEGNLWTPPRLHAGAEPGDPSGMSAFGRWMYGPWFWPPAKDAKYPPIANPYYDPTLRPERRRPFCEPALIPSTPNVSVGMEAFNDTPDRQRHGLPDDHGRPEGLPLPDPERGQRPLLEPASGTSPTRPTGHAQRGRAEARRAGGRPDRPERLPDARHHARAPRARAGSRSAPRAASCRPRWSFRTSRSPGSPTRPASTSATSTSTRCCWRRPSAPTSIVDFSQFARQDADPLQRRTRRLPGARRQLRLLHGRPGPDPGRRPDHPARLRPEHPHRSCRSRCRTTRRRRHSTGPTPR